MAAKHLQLSTQIQASFGKPEDPDYVFDIVANGDRAMAVSLSTNAIKLYDPETGGFKGDLLGHTCTISGLDFPDASSPQLLFSSSTDSTIRAWDVRVGKQVDVFRAKEQSDEIWSFSVGGSQAHLIAGGGNAHVLLWDRRSKKLGAYMDEVHTEPVTHVKFHPSKREQLLTASVDGLINIFDTKRDFHSDEFVENTLNVGTSLSKFGFYGKDNQMVWVLTHIETLSIWDLEDQSEAITFGDTRTKASFCWGLPSVTYLINCHSTPGTESLWLTAGNNDGTVGFFPITSTKSGNNSPPSLGVFGDVSAVLEGGHEGVVRTICMNQTLGLEQAQFCWTGGEDGRLCSWSQNGSTQIGRAWISSNLVIRKHNSSKRRPAPY